jgi:hypothetical protein
MDMRRRQEQFPKDLDMKLRTCDRDRSALTAVEIIVVVAAMLLLLAMLLPALAAAKKKSSRIGCSNCLKQVGLALRIWSGDNYDLFPTGVPVAQGGAKEAVQAGNPVPVFQVMSNELSTPKILICPNDVSRFYATNFENLNNSNVSYFVSLDTTNEVNPQLIVSGDSNFMLGRKAVKSGLLLVPANDPVQWSSARHKNAGYISLADGSVQSVTTAGLKTLLDNTEIPTNRLAIP